MPPIVRDTLSLRPQGFYGYAFLITRIAQIVSLAVITGLVADLLSTETRGNQPASSSLIALVLFTSAGLLWSLLSWTGYSRRYLAYAATWSVDLVFLILFIAAAVVLGLPLGDTRCAAVAPNGRFEITAPPGTSFGRIVFSGDGKAACSKLLIVWGVLIAVCVLFAVSALSAAFLDMGERQLSTAMAAAKEESRGVGRAASYRRGVNGSGNREFAPMLAAQPAATWTAVGSERAGPNDFGYLAAAPRPGIGEERLNLNRPVTINPARAGNSMISTGSGYGESLEQPPAVRMRQPPLGNGFGLPGNPRGGSGKATASNESMDDSSPATLAKLEGKPPESSIRAPLRNSRRRASSDLTVRGSNIGVIPIAILSSESAPFGKAPTGSRGPMRREDPRDRRYQAEPQEWNLRPNFLKFSTGSGIPNSPHESLMPKPLAVAQRGNSRKQRLKEESTESGWWGALASVIERPQAAYDPSNVI
ncbi:hypothetical protein C8A03DRAFT_13221 [Achaetomium macrosporum]|uniref:MARVEL domain-containing protein n=1 Tax=Achaetomium macrosporum TaxID=79813 RepID=A0AAN7HFZ1_9PEZI|nr:hypothetical protein C8A03DRAFT_13221 [Achaetomium macrosporum]